MPCTSCTQANTKSDEREGATQQVDQGFSSLHWQLCLIRMLNSRSEVHEAPGTQTGDFPPFPFYKKTTDRWPLHEPCLRLLRPPQGTHMTSKIFTRSQRLCLDLEYGLPLSVSLQKRAPGLAFHQTPVHITKGVPPTEQQLEARHNLDRCTASGKAQSHPALQL